MSIASERLEKTKDGWPVRGLFIHYIGPRAFPCVRCTACNRDIEHVADAGIVWANRLEQASVLCTQCFDRQIDVGWMPLARFLLGLLQCLGATEIKQLRRDASGHPHGPKGK